MSTSGYFRVSGLVLVLGSLAGVGCHLVDSFFFGNTTAYANQPIYTLNEFGLAAATIVVLLGLAGVYGSRAAGFGVAGFIGMALVFTAEIMIGVFGNLWGAMVEPWLAMQAPNLANGYGPPAFFAFYNVEEAALVAGSILLAIPCSAGGYHHAGLPCRSFFQWSLGCSLSSSGSTRTRWESVSWTLFHMCCCWSP